MTVNQLIDELTEWANIGYAEKQVMLMNLRIDEYMSIENVNPVPDGSFLEIR